MVRKIIRSIAEKAMPSLLASYRAYDRLIRTEESYLNTSGWLRSLKEQRPCDRLGASLPWMALPVVSLLRERITRQHDLFEFGSGFSTEFYAGLAKSVVSVEHDQQWIARTKQRLPSNATVQHCPLDEDGEYCRALQRSDLNPGVVIIDGRDRVNCLLQSVPCCAASTVFVFDDTHRDRYQRGLEWAKEQGYRLLRFEGLKPEGLELNQSTLIYKPNNVFGI